MPALRLHDESRAKGDGMIGGGILASRIRDKFVCTICHKRAVKCEDPINHKFDWVLYFAVYERLLRDEGYKLEWMSL
jgi:hypothetical protein